MSEYLDTYISNYSLEIIDQKPVDEYLPLSVKKHSLEVLHPYVTPTTSYTTDYYFEGTVKEGENFASRSVLAYSSDRFTSTGRTTSNTEGSFTLYTDDPTAQYLVCLDDSGGLSYNHLTAARVTPLTASGVEIDPPTVVSGTESELIVEYKMLEESLDTLHDSSIYSNDGVITNGVIVEDETLGQVLDCNKTGGAYCPVSTTTGITGNMTISMWIKPRSLYARQNPYNQAYGGEGTMTLEIAGYINYYYGTNGGNGTPYQMFGTDYNLQINNWYHIVLVRDLYNMELRWYINGDLKNSATALYKYAKESNANIYLGSGYVSSFDGYIGLFRLYSRALTQDQILVLYNNGQGA